MNVRYFIILCIILLHVFISARCFIKIMYMLFTQVCRCGLVSFDKKYSNNKPVPVGKGKVDIIEPTIDIKDPVVAAYFADIFVDNSSSITYRTYDILNNYPFSTKATEDITILESLIKRLENLSSFEASFLLIATWNRVKAKASALNRNNVSCFSCVLRITFSIM